MYITIAKYSSLVGVGFTALHFLSAGVQVVEEVAADKFSKTSEAVVAAVAEDFGYARPDPNANLSVMQIAEKESQRAGINPSVVKSLIHVESAGELFAISPKGALGVMQIMPFNARGCGLKVAELFDRAKNIRCGVKILRANLEQNNWDLIKALRVYNGGFSCLSGRCKESEAHVQKVLARLTKDA